MNPNVVRFLREEAKKIYKEMPVELRRKSDTRHIFVELKKQWKAGNKLKAELRARA